MTRRRGRTGPSDPQDILARRALERAQARIADRDPAEWGVCAEIHQLPSSADVEIRLDDRRRVITARRNSCPYDLLHRQGGLTDAQHCAARRLFRDMAMAAGVRDGEETFLRDPGPRGDPGAPTQVMIDASRRAQLALGMVGPVNARLLKQLNEAMIGAGICVWRWIVQRATGERDRNAQAALVRQACESLLLVHQAIDQKARSEAAPAAATDQRPFSAFGGPPAACAA